MNESDRRRLPAVVAIVVLFALAASAGALIELYTDWAWFVELGREQVFKTRLLATVGLGVALGLVAAVFLGINVGVARRLRPRRGAAVPLVESWYRPFDVWLTQVREIVEPHVNPVLAGVVAVIAFGMGVSGSGAWPLLLTWLGRVPFDRLDPVFKHDISTYVFTMPLLRWAQQWALGLVAVTALVTLAVHLLDGAITPRAVGERFAPHVKAHMSVLLAVFVLLMAGGNRLARWGVLYSVVGRVTGASFTDVHARIPAYDWLFAVSIALAIALFANIRFRGWRLPLVGVGVWVASAVVLLGVWPALVQQLRVAPNELAAERPYLERNIDHVRRAFGITDLESRPFAANASLTRRQLQEESQTVTNVRLWDPSSVDRTFAQLQEIRLYYDFLDVDVDRYVIDGEPRVVMLSARELDTDQLPQSAQTWVNQHLVYTHGYGVVMSPASRVTGEGLPEFLIGDIPPESSGGAPEVTRAAIYFGEVPDRPDRYVVVRTKEAEFDYPTAGANTLTRYAGRGGIPMDSAAKKLAFAIRFSDLKFLLSSAITRESRLMFKRNIVARARTLAPFLLYDSDPYPVVVDGRIVWLQDAYTASPYYPYSERWEWGTNSFNYIRNSVKIATDAYDGTVTFYVWDPKDPVLAAWRRVYPSLFTDASEMPEGLRAHVRYPEELFNIQAEVMRTYHMTDPGTFYSREDLWAIPRDVTGLHSGDRGQSGPMAPYYVLMRMPGEPSEDFILMLPFTPNGKNNMIAWLAATCDPDAYGRLSLFGFPKQRLVFGPEQIDAKLNQDPQISAQLTLWNQQGSKVLRGSMLVIPVRQSVLYVQPIYLSAAQSQFPQLEQVVVAFGGKLVMEDDIGAALTAVFGGAPEAVEPPTETTRAPPAGAPVPTDKAARIAELVRQASEEFAAAEAAARAGDWATYGTKIAALKSTLARLGAESGTQR